MPVGKLLLWQGDYIMSRNVAFVYVPHTTSCALHFGCTQNKTQPITDRWRICKFDANNVLSTNGCDNNARTQNNLLQWRRMRRAMDVSRWNREEMPNIDRGEAVLWRQQNRSNIKVSFPQSFMFESLFPFTHSLIWRLSRVADTHPLVPISRYSYCLFVADVSLMLVPCVRPIIRWNVMPHFLTRWKVSRHQWGWPLCCVY